MQQQQTSAFASPSQSTWARNTGVEEPWKVESQRVAETLEQLKHMTEKSKTTSILKNDPYAPLRVNQLDAHILDKELIEIVKIQFMKIFTFSRASIMNKFGPELDLFLNALIFRISLWQRNTTYGNQLQNLVYDELKPLKKFLFFFLTSGIKYLAERLPNTVDILMALLRLIFLVKRRIFGFLSTIKSWKKQQNGHERQSDEDDSATSYRRSIVLLSRYLSALHSLMSTLNVTMLFMWTGHYPTLIERILGMKVKYLHSSMARRVSFEYMNRQLVWNGFTEFMLFVMPLINVQKLRSMAWQLVRCLPLLGTWITSNSTVAWHSNEGTKSCLFCGAEPIHTPYITNCQHLFCYYCIKTALMSDDKLSCPCCGHLITNITRYQPHK
jgi:peroxin-2